MYLPRKTLLHLLLVHQTLWFYLLNYIKMYFERKENKNTSWPKKCIYPGQDLEYYFPQYVWCIPSVKWLSLAFTKQLRDALLNISKRLLIVLCLFSSPCDGMQPVNQLKYLFLLVVGLKCLWNITSHFNCSFYSYLQSMLLGPICFFWGYMYWTLT